MSLWDIMVSIFWFFVLFAWIWLLITILSDIFRDHELSGWGKAGWTLFLLVLPWVGALTYLIVRGRSMNERARAQAERNDRAFRRYVQDAAPSPVSTADELAKLVDLRDRGAISTADYERAKATVLGQAPAPSVPRQQEPRAAATIT
jgi:Phospholipase_D-nuclease N-terminal/Short C-terminal domain